MTVATPIYQGPVQRGPETASTPNVGAPPQPEEFCGIPVDALQRLGRATIDTCVLPYRYTSVVTGLRKILPHAELVETIASSGTTADAIGKHLPAIKEAVSTFVPELKTVEKVAKHVPPLQRMIDRRVTNAVLHRGPEIFAKGHEQLAKAQKHVDFLASFENPREQFTNEVNSIATRVGAAALSAREERIRTNLEPEYETPNGLLGVVVRVVRGIKKFFGQMFGFGKRETQPSDVTAYDAGRGISRVIEELSQPGESSTQRLPIFTRYVVPQLGKIAQFSPDKLALAAPELLDLLYSLMPDDETGQKIRQSVARNPHELRFLTSLKQQYGRYDLDKIKRASQTLFPAIRDVLPTTNTQVHETYTQLQRLFRSSPAVQSGDTISAPGIRTKRQAWRTVFRRLLSPNDHLPQRGQQKEHEKLTFHDAIKRLRPDKELHQPWRVAVRRLLEHDNAE